MRISRFSLAGIAVVLAGAGAGKEAAAADLTVTTATTTPIVTSNANAGPGNVTVNSGASVTVNGAQTAVTVDSNNSVTNNGALASENDDGSRGVVINGGFVGPLTVTNGGQINLLETYTQTDSDNDGDLDGANAQGTDRYGIRLLAGGTYIGTITNTGQITVEGNNSSGITLEALMQGNLLSTGSIAVTGANSNAIAIRGGAGAGVTGNVRVAGTISARGQNTGGMLVDAPITGGLRLNGAWNVTGYNTTLAPTTTAGIAAIDADDVLQGAAALTVRYSIGSGILVEGTGVENDDDDDQDSVNDDTDADDNVTATIRSFGGAPSILVQADSSANLALGATSSGFAIDIRGLVEAYGVYDGIDATAIRLERQGGSTVTLAGGIVNDNRITAVAEEAESYGLVVNAGVTVPTFLNRGQLNSTTSSETLQTAYGVLINSGATLTSLNNSGAINTVLNGEIGDARTIVDLSNTLATITNSGTILAQIIVTDDNLDDNVVPPITGDTVAIDVSASSIGVTINQIPDTPFTDLDTTDDDASNRPAVRIQGDVLLGSGADTVNLTAGAINGALSFGAGADSFVINGGAAYAGRLTDGDGALGINVQNGVLELRGGTTNITTATFAADSELRVLISNTLGDSSALIASGDVTFDAGAVVLPLVPEGLPTGGQYTFLVANGTLFGASNVTGVVSGANTPFVYNLSVAVNGVDPNALDAIYTIKTGAQLGLTANQTAAFAPIIQALRGDDAASNALASLDTSAEFFDAYEDLMPSYSSAGAELAATAIQQQQSAATNRLAATRLQGLDEVNVWAQEIGYSLTREPLTANGQAYDGTGFGFAIGIDGPLDNGALFGLSASFITSETEEEGRPEGEIAATFGQLNAYLGTAMGPVDLDFVGGLGVGQMSSRRFVSIGPSYDAIAEGEWWAYEGHGAIRASLPLSLADWFIVTPQAAITYVGLQEQGYSEENGGAAINFEVDETFSQRLWGDVGLEFATRFNLRGGGVIAPRLYAGYRANLIDEAAERTFRSAAGGASFTLVDEGYGDGSPLVGLGIDASNGFSTLSISYEGELGDQVERHSVNAAIRFRF